MKSLFLSLIGVAVFILVVGLITKTSRGETTFFSQLLHPASQTPSPTGLTNLKEMTIGKTVVMVQIADTQEERAKGLSNISNLPQGQGMLFVFENKGTTPSFWMKDMLIPLDFIWIAGGKVSEITPNVPNPAPGTPDSRLQVYTPSMPIDYVLEVNAGWASTNNIKVGDNVSL